MSLYYLDNYTTASIVYSIWFQIKTVYKMCNRLNYPLSWLNPGIVFLRPVVENSLEQYFQGVRRLSSSCDCCCRCCSPWFFAAQPLLPAHNHDEPRPKLTSRSQWIPIKFNHSNHVKAPIRFKKVRFDMCFTFHTVVTTFRPGPHGAGGGSDSVFMG